MMNSIIRVALIIVLVIVIGAACVRSLPYDVVAVGEPVRQDDFLYTVTNVERHRAGDTVSYNVTVRVDNQAKVVDYRWSDDTAYVSDSTGRRYQALKSGPSVASDRPPVAAGSSASYELTFELPITAAHPMLHYWNGFMMGDIFDGAAYGRIAVPL
ncbi:MAG TPA: hypothetical protein VII69_12740 [Candidatus Eremiobacteraceae bacterium]